MNLYCTICMELFSASHYVYATNCGHVFHYSCLSQWLERSKSCPQCRSKCYERHTQRIYLNTNNPDDNLDVVELQRSLEEAQRKIMLLQKDLDKRKDEVQRQKCMEETIGCMEKELKKKDFLIKGFKEKNKIVDDLKKEVKDLRNQIGMMESVESILTTTVEDADRLLEVENNPKLLSIWVTTLKRELSKCEGKKTKLRSSLRTAQHELRKERELRGSLEEKISQLESDNNGLSEIVSKLDQYKGDPSGAADNTPSPSILEKVKRIEECNSSYFDIKPNGVGLAPLLEFISRKRKQLDVGGVIQSGTIPFKIPRVVLENTKIQNRAICVEIGFSFDYKEKKNKAKDN